MNDTAAEERLILPPVGLEVPKYHIHPEVLVGLDKNDPFGPKTLENMPVHRARHSSARTLASSSLSVSASAIVTLTTVG